MTTSALSQDHNMYPKHRRPTMHMVVPITLKRQSPCGYVHKEMHWIAWSPFWIHSSSLPLNCDIQPCDITPSCGLCSSLSMLKSTLLSTRTCISLLYQTKHSLQQNSNCITNFLFVYIHGIFIVRCGKRGRQSSTAQRTLCSFVTKIVPDDHCTTPSGQAQLHDQPSPLSLQEYDCVLAQRSASGEVVTGDVTHTTVCSQLCTSSRGRNVV